MIVFFWITLGAGERCFETGMDAREGPAEPVSFLP